MIDGPDAGDLADIEAIKQLKARYFRLMDTKQWNEWADVFTSECTLRWGDGPDQRVEGREQTVAELSRRLEDAITVHHGHMPEIEITGAMSATGIWAMYDYVDRPLRAFQGWGHYHEEYEKGEDGRWRIRKLVLTRIREDDVPPRPRDD